MCAPQQETKHAVPQDSQSTTVGAGQQAATSGKKPPEIQPLAQLVIRSLTQSVAQPDAQDADHPDDASTQNPQDYACAKRTVDTLVEDPAVLILDLFMHNALKESEQEPIAQHEAQPGAQRGTQHEVQPVAHHLGQFVAYRVSHLATGGKSCYPYATERGSLIGGKPLAQPNEDHKKTSK